MWLIHNVVCIYTCIRSTWTVSATQWTLLRMISFPYGRGKYTLTLTHTHTHAHTHPHTHSLSLTHTNTHTHTQTYKHACTYTTPLQLKFAFSLSWPITAYFRNSASAHFTRAMFIFVMRITTKLHSISHICTIMYLFCYDSHVVLWFRVCTAHMHTYT